MAALPAAIAVPSIARPMPPPSSRDLKALSGLTASGTMPSGPPPENSTEKARRQQQDDLADQGDAQERRGDVDVEVAEEADDDDADDGDEQPVDVDVEPAVQGVVGEVGEDADQRALEDDVGHRRERAGGHAPHLAEAVGDEAVERAGGGDVAGHRDEPDGEQRQHDRSPPGSRPGRRCRCRSRSRSGVLPVIAVIGAAFATAMNSTPPSPIAPAFRRVGVPALPASACAASRSRLAGRHVSLRPSRVHLAAGDSSKPNRPHASHAVAADLIRCVPSHFAACVPARPRRLTRRHRRRRPASPDC